MPVGKAMSDCAASALLEVGIAQGDDCQHGEEDGETQQNADHRADKAVLVVEAHPQKILQGSIMRAGKPDVEFACKMITQMFVSLSCGPGCAILEFYCKPGSRATCQAARCKCTGGIGIEGWNEFAPQW